ncbi:glycosyltransferase family 4 protein [bacterium]|nr:glycosyltransferase family 4 protein [bacterium]
MSTKPGICFVSMEVYPNLRPGVAEEAGGAGFQLVQLARGLRDRGHPVSFVVGDYGQAFREEIDGFTVYRANRVAYDRSVVRGLQNLWRLFAAMRAADARHYVLRSTRFLSFFVMFYARLLGAKYTFMVANLPHCLRNELESLPRLFRTLYEVSLNRAARVTVQSREQQVLLEQNFGIRAPIVSNGIEVPPFEGPRLAAEFDFVWVASFKVQKRADKLVEIARQLPHRSFLVVGGPGPDKAYSAGLVAQLQELPNVTFRGFVPPDRVGEVYRQARIFLNTSDWEGFPNGFLYAWTRGIPACSLCIDPDEAVTGGDLGLVDPDLAGLAAAMDTLLGDDQRYAAMARRCHDHVQRRHSLDHAVDEFLAALP